MARFPGAGSSIAGQTHSCCSRRSALAPPAVVHFSLRPKANLGHFSPGDVTVRPARYDLPSIEGVMAGPPSVGQPPTTVSARILRQPSPPDSGLSSAPQRSVASRAAGNEDLHPAVRTLVVQAHAHPGVVGLHQQLTSIMHLAHQRRATLLPGAEVLRKLHLVVDAAVRVPILRPRRPQRQPVAG